MFKVKGAVCVFSPESPANPIQSTSTGLNNYLIRAFVKETRRGFRVFYHLSLTDFLELSLTEFLESYKDKQLAPRFRYFSREMIPPQPRTNNPIPQSSPGYSVIDSILESPSVDKIQSLYPPSSLPKQENLNTIDVEIRGREGSFQY